MEKFKNIFSGSSEPEETDETGIIDDVISILKFKLPKN
jgi:hypothetical protein